MTRAELEARRRYRQPWPQMDGTTAEDEAQAVREIEAMEAAWRAVSCPLTRAARRGMGQNRRCRLQA